MVTAAQTVLEPAERERARRRYSDAALTTMEPAERVRAEQARYGTRSGRTPTGPARARRAHEGQGHPDGTGLHLHTRTFHPAVPVPYPSVENLPASLQKVPARDMLFYGGLGALTVAGALEWPIALAIGGATWVVRSRRKEAH
ncbi:hypothetical protein [Streptomyces collinus]|uniref:hypothetical protein n=1 Tax=Streptomyces collinus TaxID=42684 RepID=UPI0033242873